ncbi:hypothetical protein LBMAG38_04970 [Chloroflexota bacterium]|nr:hypothetical protein LBMAG38_04970 [Chloroflexota bacterium]
MNILPKLLRAHRQPLKVPQPSLPGPLRAVLSARSGVKVGARVVVKDAEARVVVKDAEADVTSGRDARSAHSV